MIGIPVFGFDRSEWVERPYLNGRKLSDLICGWISKKLPPSSPGLAVLIVGDDPASHIYVGSKEKKARSLGFHSEVKKLPQNTDQKTITDIIEGWNHDPRIHGILVQLPLPHSVNAQEVLSKISVDKDADGFHLENIGRLFSNHAGTIPCTPLGIMVMLNELGESLKGKHAVILGRSNIVGKPMAQLLLDFAHCTVTLCHSRTKDLPALVREADILISAMGRQNIVSGGDVKKGAIVIDVGIHRSDQGLSGDLEHKELIDKVSFITPVPGGVGPMTIAMLMYNTYHNFLRSQT